MGSTANEAARKALLGEQGYEAARAALMAGSGFWTLLVALLAGAVLAVAAWALLRRRGIDRPSDEPSQAPNVILGRLSMALSLALWAGWARLAYFHYQIWQNVQIPDIASGGGYVQLSGKTDGLAVPLWIEGEKLYAWACLLALAVVLLGRRRDDPVFVWGSMVLGALTLCALWATNPFTVPLPNLHSELVEYFRGGAVQAMWARKTFFYNSAYMWTHPPALFVSYAAFVVSFIASVLRLRTRAVRYDRIAYAYAKFGYLVLTGGMLIGYPWAILAWKGDPWWWSGKINMSLMMWVMYSAYLHSRLYLKQRGMWKLAGWLSVACFVTLVMTYLSTYLVPGAHSVAGQ